MTGFYIEEALKRIARHSQYKQVSNELLLISHHLNETELFAFLFPNNVVSVVESAWKWHYLFVTAYMGFDCGNKTDYRA